MGANVNTSASVNVIGSMTKTVTVIVETMTMIMITIKEDPVTTEMIIELILTRSVKEIITKVETVTFLHILIEDIEEFSTDDGGWVTVRYKRNYHNR